MLVSKASSLKNPIEQDPALARVKTKVNVNEDKTDSELNNETGEDSEESASPPQTLCHTAPVSHPFKTSAGVHFVRGRLPVQG